ncbi:hypothetical protein [Paraburkholderia panacisoli]|uniref:hypothetical protein n=1 Tax=Paraburkholderia panacisoli TaxID=2603818 RepID=UPI001FE92CD4|nr:hypothetical protein [Paraburkholderia panacisoli]
MQKKVGWFGTGLLEMKRSVSDEAVHVAAEEASPVEASVEATPAAEWDAPDEKKGFALAPARVDVLTHFCSWRLPQIPDSRGPELGLGDSTLNDKSLSFFLHKTVRAVAVEQWLQAVAHASKAEMRG